MIVFQRIHQNPIQIHKCIVNQFAIDYKSVLTFVFKQSLDSCLKKWLHLSSKITFCLYINFLHVSTLVILFLYSLINQKRNLSIYKSGMTVLSFQNLKPISFCLHVWAQTLLRTVSLKLQSLKDLDRKQLDQSLPSYQIGIRNLSVC